MDYQTFLNTHLSSHPETPTGLQWWAGLLLLPAGANQLLLNMTNDQQFEMAPTAQVHAIRYNAELRNVIETDPVKWARRGLNDCLISPCGRIAPNAGLNWYKFVSVRDLVRFYARENLKDGWLETPEAPRTFAENLNNKRNFYEEYIDQDQELRGEIPCNFWAYGPDLEGYRNGGLNASIQELLRFLGVEAVNSPFALFQLDVAASQIDGIRFHVPTAFEAFENYYFWAQPAERVEGATWDLNTSPDPDKKARGAKEMVTKPIKIKHLKFVRAYIP